MSTEPRDEYTPLMDEIRDAAGPDGAIAIEHAAFDRALAAHDREVAAAAVRRAADLVRPGYRVELMTVSATEPGGAAMVGVFAANEALHKAAVRLERHAAAIREGRTDA